MCMYIREFINGKFVLHRQDAPVVADRVVLHGAGVDVGPPAAVRRVHDLLVLGVGTERCVRDLLADSRCSCLQLAIGVHIAFVPAPSAMGNCALCVSAKNNVPSFIAETQICTVQLRYVGRV